MIRNDGSWKVHLGPQQLPKGTLQVLQASGSGCRGVFRCSILHILIGTCDGRLLILLRSFNPVFAASFTVTVLR